MEELFLLKHMCDHEMKVLVIGKFFPALQFR